MYSSFDIVKGGVEEAEGAAGFEEEPGAGAEVQQPVQHVDLLDPRLQLRRQHQAAGGGQAKEEVLLVKWSNTFILISIITIFRIPKQ